MGRRIGVVESKPSSKTRALPKPAMRTMRCFGYPALEISGNIGATGMEWKLLTPDFRYRHPFITHSRDLERGGPVCTTPHCRLTRDFPPISPDCRISTAFLRRARFRSRC